MKKRQSHLGADLIRAAASLLFPSSCLCCGIFLPLEQKICRNCLDQLPVISITDPVCRRCGRPFRGITGTNHLCGRCLGSPAPLSSVYSIALYVEPVKTALKRLKYQGDTTGIPLLAACLEQSGFSLTGAVSCRLDYIIPVPLHIKRLRKRGVNQSLMLAKKLFPEHKNIIRPELLKRRINTISQTFLDKKERRLNLKNAFQAGPKNQLAGKNICLIDDIYTTGSTLDECAKTLIKSGVNEVHAITIARTSAR